MLKITSRIGLPVTETSGIDCLQMCLNKEHFRNYPKEITYQYNSRGFRDSEWPDDLSDVTWCIGDSFTAGTGQPYEEIWPKLLEKKTGKRCINLGEDGCSNDTMALRAQEICKLYRPKLIVVMWSYLARRRKENRNIHYNEFSHLDDIINFLKNYNIVNKLSVNTIHSAIPGIFYGHESLFKKFLSKNYINDIIFYDQIDYARDYHHFDIKTSKGVCDLIEKKINNFDKTSK